MFLGIDYGKKRIGLAVGSKFPRGIGVLDGDRNEHLIVTDIAEICHEEDVEKIIIGFPERHQGEAGTLANEIKQFAQAIHNKTNLPIVFEPEAFTSTEAEEFLKTHTKQPGDKDKVDELAAVLILEQYIYKISEKKDTPYEQDPSLDVGV